MKRARWATRSGLILAMAGNAIGLGNLLRFPVQAASNGGGAFLIPYFVCLVVLGVPLMWVEWGVGRLGGSHGHGHTSGMFGVVWDRPISPYLGVLGLWVPIGILTYYLYIASWAAGYAFLSISGQIPATGSREEMAALLGEYTAGSQLPLAYCFLVLTVLLNFLITRRTVSRGIEVLGRIGMPLLLLLAVGLVFRVLTIDAETLPTAKGTISDGFGFIWNPNFGSLTDAKVWLAAAGQVFFTLSLGMGVLQCYASYLTQSDDLALSGLTTVTINEIVEVVVGGSLAIPLAVVFFGVGATQEIAGGGSFDLGFMSLPLAFASLPGGEFLGGCWFALLYLAAITSTVALSAPLIAFFEENVGMRRTRAAIVVWTFAFLACHLAVFGGGVIEELDFWIGTVGIVLFALVQVIVWGWGLGAEEGLREIERGALIRVPRFVVPVWRFACPVILVVLLASWLWQSAPDVVAMRDVASEQVLWRWLARGYMALCLVALIWMVHRTQGTSSAMPEEK